MQSELTDSLAVGGAGVIDYPGYEENPPQSGTIIGSFICPMPVWVCCSQYTSPLDIALRNLVQPVNSEFRIKGEN